MSQRKSVVCDVCEEIAVYTKNPKGAPRKPPGWSIVRYEGQNKTFRIDLCPKHTEEFEDRYGSANRNTSE